MGIRGTVTLECDRKGCHAEEVIEAEDATETMRGDALVGFLFHAPDWVVDDDGLLHCPQCCEDDRQRDEAYERAAARARNNDFADTGGKDWT
jgi:hypothetical protein